MLLPGEQQKNTENYKGNRYCHREVYSNLDELIAWRRRDEDNNICLFFILIICISIKMDHISLFFSNKSSCFFFSLWIFSVVLFNMCINKYGCSRFMSQFLHKKLPCFSLYLDQGSCIKWIISILFLCFLHTDAGNCLWAPFNFCVLMIQLIAPTNA